MKLLPKSSDIINIINHPLKEHATSLIPVRFFFHGVFPTLSQVLKALPPPAKAVKIVATVMALKGYLDTWKTRKNRLHQKKDSLLTLPAQQESYQLKKVLYKIYIYYNILYEYLKIYLEKI